MAPRKTTDDTRTAVLQDTTCRLCDANHHHVPYPSSARLALLFGADDSPPLSRTPACGKSTSLVSSDERAHLRKARSVLVVTLDFPIRETLVCGRRMYPFRKWDNLTPSSSPRMCMQQSI
jgi:hypothetical protein